MPTTIQAAARATTKPKSDRSRNRNRPGYKQPNKIGTKSVCTDAPIATHAAFYRAAKAEGKTAKALLLEYVTAKAQPFMTHEIKEERVKQQPARVGVKQSKSHASLGLA